MEIEDWDAERTAVEFDLPLEAVFEAQQYLAQTRDLVLSEERENRLASESARSASASR